MLQLPLMEAKKNKSQPLYFQIVLIGGFIFIGMMLFALARSIYRDSFQVGKYVQTSVLTIEEEKENLAAKPSELAYAESALYQEKVAKELLGKKLPGEEVIILSSEKQAYEDLLPEGVNKNENLELLTLSQRWWRYLFGI